MEHLTYEQPTYAVNLTASEWLDALLALADKIELLDQLSMTDRERTVLVDPYREVRAKIIEQLPARSTS